MGLTKNLEESGAAILYENGFGKMFGLIPDSEGKSKDEVDKMPLYIRNIRCGKGIEKGGSCKSEKFSMSVCPNRKFRTSWHPGWKEHGLRGNYLALFLIQILEESLKDIMSSPDLDDMRMELQSQEKADHEEFLGSELPPYSNQWPAPESQADKIRRILYKGSNFCHAAELPAEIRYKGILTESEPVDMFNLPPEFPTPPNGLRIAPDKWNRQTCTVPLNMDYADHFYIHNSDGWKEMTLPNDREVEEYGTNEPPKGLLSICHTRCPWNKCPPEYIMGGVQAKAIEIEVNGVPAISEFPIDKGCFLLENTGGYFWKPDPNGKFTFRIRVNGARKYSRFGYFIIF